MTNVSPMAVAMMQADLYRRHALHRGDAAVATITTTYQGYRRAREEVVYTDTESTVLDIDVEVPFGVHPSWIDLFDAWGAAPGARAIVTVGMNTPTTWHLEIEGSSLDVSHVKERVTALEKDVRTAYGHDLAKDEHITIGIMNGHRAVRLVNGDGPSAINSELDINIDHISFDEAFTDHPYRRIMITIGPDSLSYVVYEPGQPSERVTLR